jgi:small GTP-binding protein
MKKIAILGTGGVGKSCLTLRFITNQFCEDYDATIEDSYRKAIEVDGTIEQLEIIDTAGQEEFFSLIDGWIRESDGIILVYDITNMQSFDELSYFYDRIVQCKDTYDVPLVMVGNKCDLEAKVSELQAKMLASKWNCPLIFASAKKRIHHDLAFYEIVNEIHKKRKEVSKKKPSSVCVLL